MLFSAPLGPPDSAVPVGPESPLPLTGLRPAAPRVLCRILEPQSRVNLGPDSQERHIEEENRSVSRAEPVGRADSPERACAAALTARPWGHQSWEPLLQAGGTSGSRRGLLWKPPLQPPSEEGEALHQQAPAAPRGHSMLAPRSPLFLTMLSQGVLETLQAQRVICANALSWGCGSRVLSSRSPSALSPRVPLPWTLASPPGAHDALGLPGVLPALLQPCTPAVSISPFPAPRLGQAWVSGYLAGGRPSSQLVQPPVLWSGLGHGPQLCKQHVAQLLLGQRTDAHSASRGNTRLCRTPARCACPRRRPVSTRSGSA